LAYKPIALDQINTTKTIVTPRHNDIKTTNRCFKSNCY